MASQTTPRGQVDVTHVKRGQVAAMTRLRPQPSQRAQDAIARAAERRRAAK